MFVRLKRLNGYKTNVGKSKRNKGVYYTDMGLAYTLGRWYGYEVMRTSHGELDQLVNEGYTGKGKLRASGLADNEDQVLARFKHLENHKGKFVIEMHPVLRKNEPELHGFRFHKWGEYIGDFDINREYLYDQKDMDVIYVFSIIPLSSGQTTTVFNRVSKPNIRKMVRTRTIRRKNEKSSYKTYQKR